MFCLEPVWQKPSFPSSAHITIPQPLPAAQMEPALATPAERLESRTAPLLPATRNLDVLEEILKHSKEYGRESVVRYARVCMWSCLHVTHKAFVNVGGTLDMTPCSLWTACTFWEASLWRDFAGLT